MARAEMHKVKNKKNSANISDAIGSSTHTHTQTHMTHTCTSIYICTYIQHILAGLQSCVTNCMARLELFLAHNSTSIDVAQSEAKATTTATTIEKKKRISNIKTALLLVTGCTYNDAGE